MPVKVEIKGNKAKCVFKSCYVPSYSNHTTNTPFYVKLSKDQLALSNYDHIIISELEKKKIEADLVNLILHICTQYFNVTREQLNSRSREGRLVRSRAMIFWLIKEYQPWMGLATIAKIFNRGHATAIHHIRDIDFSKGHDVELKSDIEKITGLLKKYSTSTKLNSIFNEQA